MDCVGAVLGVCFIIYEINCVLVCMRPEMAMEFKFTKWNRCWMVAMNSNPRVSLFMNSVHEIFL